MAVNKLAAHITVEDDAPLAPTGVVPASHRVKLWDLPLRVFHWSLLAAVTTAIVTGKLGGEWMSLHGNAGIAIVGLLAFRVVWGLVGSGTARFAHFLPTPGALLAYVKGRWRGIGHNPLGALSVVALIGVIGFQAVSGLLSNDDIAFAGPLAGLVEEELSQWFTGWHHQVVNGLFLLLGLHIVAVFFHVKFKKDDIVTPMVTGWKKVPITQAAPRQARFVALILALAAGLAAGYAASGDWIKPDAPPASSIDPSSSTSTGAPAAKSPATAAPAW